MMHMYGFRNELHTSIYVVLAVSTSGMVRQVMIDSCVTTSTLLSSIGLLPPPPHGQPQSTASKPFTHMARLKQPFAPFFPGLAVEGSSKKV
jgi:hypothetical protein